jgi:trigger factor
VGDVVTVSTKGLFADDHDLMKYLGVPHDNVHGLDVEVNFTIAEINGYELAEINQELLDKLFGEGKVTSVDELKQKIKEDAEQQFATQADQKFMNDVTDYLLENTKFDLPADFLKKWLQQAGETPMSPEQAEEEYNKSEKGLRYQLIEGKIITENNLQVTFEELKAFAGDIIRKQMAQFGQMNPTDEDIENITARILSNQEEVKRLSDQLISQKVLQLFSEKSGAKTKEVTYSEFIKISYGE